MKSRGSIVGFTRTESRSAGRKPKARADHAIRASALPIFPMHDGLTFRAGEFERLRFSVLSRRDVIFARFIGNLWIGIRLATSCLWWSRVLRSRFPSPPLNRAPSCRRGSNSQMERFPAYAIEVAIFFEIYRGPITRIWMKTCQWKHVCLEEKVVRSIIDSNRCAPRPADCTSRKYRSFETSWIAFNVYAFINFGPWSIFARLWTFLWKCKKWRKDTTMYINIFVASISDRTSHTTRKSICFYIPRHSLYFLIRDQTSCFLIRALNTLSTVRFSSSFPRSTSGSFKTPEHSRVRCTAHDSLPSNCVHMPISIYISKTNESDSLE